MLKPEPDVPPVYARRDVAIPVADGWRVSLHRLGSQKLLLVAMALVGFAIAAADVVLVPRNYTAESQLVIDPRGLQVVGQDLTPPPQTSDVTTALMETHLRVLLSDSVLGRVVKDAGLAEDPEFNGTEQNPVATARAMVARLTGGRGSPEPPDVVALRTLQKKVWAERVDRGYVIAVRVTAHDPDKAARLTRMVAEIDIAEDADARRELARRAGQEVTDRLAGLAAQVKRAEDAAEAFKAAHGLVGADGQLVSAQELSALNAQFVAAQTRTSELKARAEQMEAITRSGTIPDTVAESIGSSTITALRTRYADLIRLQADTATRLGPRHPDTAAIGAQVGRMRAQINDELTRISRATRADYERARANETALGASLEAQKRKAITVSQALVRLRELDRGAQASRDVYGAFLARSREIGEQQRVDTGNVRVISPALPPNKPNGQPAAVILAGGGLLGLALGCALALAPAAMRRQGWMEA